MTNTTNQSPKQPLDIGSLITSQWFILIFLPLVGGIIATWIGLSTDTTWLTVVGFFALIIGAAGAYQLVPFLQSGFPLIVIGLVVGWIFYSMEFWVGLLVAIAIVALGGYNLYGKAVAAAGDMLETGLDAAGGKIAKAVNKKPNPVSEDDDTHVA